ncbi:hypothetical protein ANCCAN_19436, partial [Ancylostoma caninum]
DSDTYQEFRNIVLTKSFQRDLSKATSDGGTSTYMQKQTRPVSVVLSQRNILMMQIQRKYKRMKPTIVIKSSVPHEWRDDVSAEVLSARVRTLNAHEDCLDIDQLPHEIGGMMMAKEASESDYGVEL